MPHMVQCNALLLYLFIMSICHLKYFRFLYEARLFLYSVVHNSPAVLHMQGYEYAIELEVRLYGPCIWKWVSLCPVYK